MRIRRLLIAFVLLGAVVMPASVALATDGLWEVSTDTTLTEDHDGAIHIVADGVTLDCDGYTVSDIVVEESIAGIVLRDVTGVTVKSCIVFGPDFGILIENSHNNTIKNNVATGGTDSAFRIDGGTGNTLKNNHAEFSGSHGFEFAFASHNTLLRNTSENNHLSFSENGAGFALNDFSHSNVLKGNEASSNFSGLLISTYSTDNKVIKNDFSGNVIGVLVGEFSTANKLLKNQMTDNDEIGFAALGNSPDNVLIRNKLCRNGEANLLYDDDSEPILKKNKICPY